MRLSQSIVDQDDSESIDDQASKWLSVIGDSTYQDTDKCQVYAPAKGENGTMVPLYITIGHQPNNGINYISLAFRKSYSDSASQDSTGLTRTVNLEIGSTDSTTELISLAFSQSSQLIGFLGVTSEYGLPINKLGVVTFTCSQVQVDQDAYLTSEESSDEENNEANEDITDTDNEEDVEDQIEEEEIETLDET